MPAVEHRRRDTRLRRGAIPDCRQPLLANRLRARAPATTLVPAANTNRCPTTYALSTFGPPIFLQGQMRYWRYSGSPPESAMTEPPAVAPLRAPPPRLPLAPTPRESPREPSAPEPPVLNPLTITLGEPSTRAPGPPQ